MSRRSSLMMVVPPPVRQSLRRLGANLKTARLRRNLSLDTVATKIGIDPRVVADAERGRPSTDIAVYMSLLWVYGLLKTAEDLAAPEIDRMGIILASLGDRPGKRTISGFGDDL